MAVIDSFLLNRVKGNDMLVVVRSLRELRFGQLMDVYAESNSISGKKSPLQAEQDFYTYLQEYFFRDVKAFYAVWVLDGCYKAALRMEPYIDGFLLEGLETAPTDRGKGYATALVRSVLDWLADQENVIVYSHVSRSNKASLAVHRACGFAQILDYAVYIDGSVLRDSVTLRYHVNKK